ncbi:MAG: AmmeMemoRadiSam system protein B [bacterium]
MDKPKLRPLQAVAVRHEGELMVQLFDPAQLSDHVAIVPEQMVVLLALLDGTRTLADIQGALSRHFGERIPSQQIESVVQQLDEALFLDSDRFADHVRELTEAFRAAPLREATSAGSGYPAEPAALKTHLDELFTADDGPGRPEAGSADGELVGLVAPHIDFARGGPSYARAYKALGDGCDADLFVVLGTAHHGRDALYILTDKDFATPLGTVKTDAGLVHALAEHWDGDPFAEELVHRHEHSVELQLVFLQHLVGDRDIAVVPVLCGAMAQAVGAEGRPSEVAAVADFTAALREIIAGSGRKACVIASADLAHVGRHFGDDYALTPQVMGDVERADLKALDHVLSLDADAFYETVMLDGNARHLCGVPAICTLLAAVEASRCELLDYRQAVDYEIDRAVTFASLALYA